MPGRLTVLFSLVLLLIPLSAGATDYMPSVPFRLYLEDDAICIEYHKYSPLRMPTIVMVCSGSFLGRVPGHATVYSVSDPTHVSLEEHLVAEGVEVDSRTAEHEVLNGLSWADLDDPYLAGAGFDRLDSNIWIDEDVPTVSKDGVLHIPLSSLSARTREELSKDRAFVAVSDGLWIFHLFRIPGGQLSAVADGS